MWVPTFKAVAVTVDRVLALRGSHVSTLQTLNVRTLPESTGVTAAATRGGARSGPGSCAANSRSARRSRRSNCCAVLAAGVRTKAAPGAGGAASTVPPSLNAWESSGVVLTDCGTTRYSILAPAGVGGEPAHPHLCVGSTAV